MNDASHGPDFAGRRHSSGRSEHVIEDGSMVIMLKVMRVIQILEGVKRNLIVVHSCVNCVRVQIESENLLIGMGENTCMLALTFHDNQRVRGKEAVAVAAPPNLMSKASDATHGHGHVHLTSRLRRLACYTMINTSSCYRVADPPVGKGFVDSASALLRPS